jgi:hypothetical protein
MNDVINGSDVLLMINLGTPGSPSLTVIGCQRDSSFEEISDTIDVSCKSARSMRVLSGRYSQNVSLDALFVSSFQSYMRLKNANRDGEFVTLARIEDGLITQRILAKIDAMSESFPDQAESTIAVSLTADGEIENVWIIGIGVLSEVFIAYV